MNIKEAKEITECPGIAAIPGFFAHVDDPAAILDNLKRDQKPILI
ncbi:MAG: hypothetical protein ACXWTH_13255 [Methylosarcina sp.]